MKRIGRMKKLNSLRLCSQRWCQPVWPRQHPTPLLSARSKGNVTKAILKIPGTPSRTTQPPTHGSPLFPPFPTATTNTSSAAAINEQHLLALLSFPNAFLERIASRDITEFIFIISRDISKIRWGKNIYGIYVFLGYRFASLYFVYISV